MVKYVRVRAIRRFVKLAPRAYTTAMVKRMSGTDMKMSRALMITESIQPPKNPAKAPSREPKTQEVTVASRAIPMDVRPPWMILARMSLPYPSHPKRCSALGFASM